MQLYLYDFSEIDGGDVNEGGEFPYRWLDHYWTESGRNPFLVYSDGRIAGFVLVRTDATAGRGPDTKSVAEFFIMRKFRRMGIGRKAAFQVFDRFRGAWEVADPGKPGRPGILESSDRRIHGWRFRGDGHGRRGMAGRGADLRQ